MSYFRLHLILSNPYIHINEDPWTLYRYHLVEMRPAVGLSRDTLLRERFPRIIGNARLLAVFYSGLTYNLPSFFAFVYARYSGIQSFCPCTLTRRPCFLVGSISFAVTLDEGVHSGSKAILFSSTGAVVNVSGVGIFQVHVPTRNPRNCECLSVVAFSIHTPSVVAGKHMFK